MLNSHELIFYTTSHHNFSPYASLICSMNKWKSIQFLSYPFKPFKNPMQVLWRAMQVWASLCKSHTHFHNKLTDHLLRSFNNYQYCLKPQKHATSLFNWHASRGWAKKSRQTFYFIPQKWLTLESKVKLELKTMGQEL